MVRIPRQWTSWHGAYGWHVPTNVIVCELDKKTPIFDFGGKNLEFCVQFVSAFERGCWCHLSIIWRNIYWFLMVISGSKCLVDIWKRVHKNLRPLMRFHFGAFLAWMRLPFFSSSLFVSSNFSCLINVFALKVPKSPSIVVIKNILNNRSWKKVMKGFERIKMVPDREIL